MQLLIVNTQAFLPLGRFTQAGIREALYNREVVFHCQVAPNMPEFIVPHFTTTFCVVEPRVQIQDKKFRLVQNLGKMFRL